MVLVPKLLITGWSQSTLPHTLWHVDSGSTFMSSCAAQSHSREMHAVKRKQQRVNTQTATQVRVGGAKGNPS